MGRTLTLTLTLAHGAYFNPTLAHGAHPNPNPSPSPWGAPARVVRAPAAPRHTCRLWAVMPPRAPLVRVRVGLELGLGLGLGVVARGRN